MFISFIKRNLKFILFKVEWRIKNKHNFTGTANVFDDRCVTVGKYTYGRIKVLNEVEGVALKIGAYCSIAEGVTFILGNDHPLNQVSTYPYKHMLVSSLISDAISKGDIIIADDVWIGYGTTIMSGVHIGQGAVIAAGAVVTKDVPPYAIVGGVPAKIIKYRFESKIIDELLKIDYGNLTKDMVINHTNELYTELNDVRQIKWMPRKSMYKDEKKK